MLRYGQLENITNPINVELSFIWNLFHMTWTFENISLHFQNLPKCMLNMYFCQYQMITTKHVSTLIIKVFKKKVSYIKALFMVIL
jgi:hypothetical protein